MANDLKNDKLEQFCGECFKQGIDYKEAQRQEWLAEERKKKEFLEKAKEREARKRRLREVCQERKINTQI